MVKAKEQPLYQFLVLLLCCYCWGVCVAIENYVTITKPLRYSETIVSPSQTFKLGFFNPANTSNHYVGIMYNVPVLTVIWVANRDNPLNDSAGTFTISEDGNLVLLNGKKEIFWSSNVSDSVRNSTAQLLDTGNFVLKDNSSGRIIWESFQIPTDSFLQRMRISAAAGTTEKLTSWSSPSDPSTGNFSFGLETLRTAQLFVRNRGKPYWRSGPWNGNVFIGIPTMSSSFLNGFSLVDGNKESAHFTFTYSSDWLAIYLQLTSEGYFQQKNWQDRQGDWEIVWSSIQNQCDVYGKCASFGSCNPQNLPICKCLPGFQPKDNAEWNRGNWTGGCIRTTSLQCERNKSAGQEGKQDGYLKLTSVKVPDFAEWSLQDSEYDCEKFCLENCSCIAYAYHEGMGCMYWGDPLIDIQQFSSGGADLYIRLDHSELDNKRDMTVIISSTVAVGFFLLLVTAYIFWRRCLTKHTGTSQDDELLLFKAGAVYQKENIKKNLKQVTFKELPLHSYETLAYATNNFHSGNKIGKGGFGQVYKGKLVDGQEIAVKRLSNTSGQGMEEFMNEVVVISRLQHRNLVRLLGCCVEREEKMLIYEYMPNKSLDAYLFDSRKQELLDWRRRALIVQGIGRGLLYLHRDSRLKIIHRDLKASNILLDENLNPKISDFGLAKIFGGNEDQADTRRVVGTYGYMAPEYAMQGIFSEKSDVYSFGVLLLEIISGRRNSSFAHDENELSLLRYAWKLWNEGEAVKLIAPSISNPNVETEIFRYMNVGLLCIQEFAKDRPNVSGILSMLNSEIPDLPCPEQPAFTRGVTYSATEVSGQRSVHSVNSVSITSVEAR